MLRVGRDPGDSQHGSLISSSNTWGYLRGVMQKPLQTAAAADVEQVATTTGTAPFSFNDGNRPNKVISRLVVKENSIAMASAS